MTVTAAVFVDSRPITVDAETTAADLKTAIEADEAAIVTYRDDGRVFILVDEDRVLDHVDPGVKLSTQPGGAAPRLFG